MGWRGSTVGINYVVGYCGGVVPANGPKRKHGNLRMKKNGKIKYRELNAVFWYLAMRAMFLVKVDDDFAVDSTLLLEMVPGCCALRCSVC